MTTTQKRNFLVAILVLTVVLTIFLWLFSKPDLGKNFQLPLLSLSQLLALLGVVSLSQTMLLSARLSWLESWLDGLDKQLHLHRYLGSLSLIAILSHPILLILQVINTPGLARIYILPGPVVSYNLGIFALYMFLLGLIFTIFIKLPYHWWFKSHQLMGLSFLFVFFHTVLIGSDLASNQILQIWIYFWLAIGLFSTFYTLFWVHFFAPSYLYKIIKLELLPEVVRLTLNPMHKALSYLPGQFVSVQFLSKNISSESHPFSLSSSPTDPHLQITIKKSGDFTNTLGQLVAGDTVKLQGPYGRFGQLLAVNLPQQVWLAGGIGITPLISLLRFEADRPTKRNIQFIYLVRDKKTAVFLPELKQLSIRLPNLKITIHTSDQLGKFTLNRQHLPDNLSQTGLLLCGPLGMMESVSKQAQDLGVKSENIQYEQFSFL